MTLPAKFKESQLKNIPFGKVITLTKPQKGKLLSIDESNLYFRGNPSILVSVSSVKYGQCVNIDGSGIHQFYGDTPVFLLQNFICNSQCRLPVTKIVSDLKEDECIIEGEAFWIIMRDPEILDCYSGMIIFNPATGNFRPLARNTTVQSTKIIRASTQQY